MDHAEQEFYYVAAVRPDGKPPHLGKAIRGRIFTDVEEAEGLRREMEVSLKGITFAVFRAIARWPGEEG